MNPKWRVVSVNSNSKFARLLNHLFLSLSNDEASNSAPGEPSLWLPDPMTCISAAERVKLGRRRAKEGDQVKT